MAEETGIRNAFKFKGYKQPSAYAMGRNAFENAVQGVGFSDLGEFNKYLADKGIGRVGKDPNATVELNRIRAEKNLDPYTKINPTQAAAEKEAFGDNPKETRGKRAQMNIRLKVISEAAEKIDGNTSKFNFIVKQVSENFPQLAKKTVMNLTKAIFMGAGPSMIAADLIPEEVLGSMARDLGMDQSPMSFKDGGIANINDITKPVGYDVGGIVPKKKPEKELTYKQIVEMLKADKTSAKEPTGFYKYLADTYPVDPINKTIDELKALGIQLSKKGSK